MAENPCKGTVYEDIWAHGFAHGQYYATDLNPTPLPMTRRPVPFGWKERSQAGKTSRSTPRYTMQSTKK